MSDQKSSGLERFGLLASSMAGRLLSVAPVECPGAPSWTDGATVFIDPDAKRRDQICSLSVQASLLASDSLNPEHVAALARRPSIAQRYLAVEGQRALAHNEKSLPPTSRHLIDRQIAGWSRSPAESLAIAMSREVVADPPHTFGTIRSRRLRPALGVQPDPNAPSRHVPRQESPRLLQELDDEDDVGALFDTVSSPVGGSGAIGRLIKKFLGDARRGNGGPPGADAATRWSRRGDRRIGAATFTTSVVSIPDLGDVVRREWTYPEWDRHRHRYRPDWCTVSEVESAPPALVPFQPPDIHALRRSLAR